MPPRDNPSARQVCLGTELRKLRERAGKTAREAAGLLAIDQAKISHIEAGRVGVGEERIRRLATFYSCHDEALIEALCAISREHRGKGWWDEYRGVLPPSFLDVAELEHHAAYIRYLQPVTVPGVFQTEGYARAMFGSVIPRLPVAEVENRVEHRLRRRAIFEREVPPQVEVVIHEAALRMRVGGRDVAREQLAHLLEACTWLHVTLRVIPFVNDDFVDVTQTVLYAGGVVPQLDTVQLDTPWGGLYLDAGAELDRYQALLDFAHQVALGPTESQQVIHNIAREL
ncbi:helix-turn-helix domain-containing protein [Streptomyces griseocarneus]|uniref:helix-turn-helix domain-containing protein n=1 Tax=Streptomyces griseocarneus TaxID=51201 RepID=UPI00167C97C0|nr:helix-turn-helix transcriptional regulator [Streptomyces griseocarneus]MBZ6473106.1 helix-turn-helix domain-containing protein [Streptomyces griseocarneus]GHG59901.1 transcriptional regulator [Streptomyces griseocarneus]